MLNLFVWKFSLECIDWWCNRCIRVLLLSHPGDTLSTLRYQVSGWPYAVSKIHSESKVRAGCARKKSIKQATFGVRARSHDLFLLWFASSPDIYGIEHVWNDSYRSMSTITTEFWQKTEANWIAIPHHDIQNIFLFHGTTSARITARALGDCRKYWF